MLTFKYTAIIIILKALVLQCSTYYCFTHHKILVLVVLLREVCNYIFFTQNCPSIKASVLFPFLSVVFITHLHKNIFNSFVIFGPWNCAKCVLISMYFRSRYNRFYHVTAKIVTCFDDVSSLCDCIAGVLQHKVKLFV